MALPPSLIDVIEYHHKPQLTTNAPVESSIVHLADILVRAWGYGFPRDNQVMPVEPAAWEILGLDETTLSRYSQKPSIP